MIIYGTRGTNGKAVIVNSTCSACNTTGPFIFQTAVRYFHVFWIPLFPFNKIGVAQCQHCKKVYDKNSFDSSMQSTLTQLKQNQKYSIFHFSGLVLIAGIVVWSMLPESEKTKQERALNQARQEKMFQSKLDTPKINDIFFAKVGDTTINGKDYRRSLALRVTRTTNDSVYFELSNFMKIDKKLSGNAFASMPLKDNAFSPENIYSSSIREPKDKISKKLILNNLAIYSIDRK
ncbi:MAG TPA: hypothetical protein VGQ59_13335 [Cyclobacteriaceae bacterium]|jgi:hypothetical protein|nr:hypothetical protein [Cyclobacteriaceae bacterium]